MFDDDDSIRSSGHFSSSNPLHDIEIDGNGGKEGSVDSSDGLVSSNKKISHLDIDDDDVDDAGDDDNIELPDMWSWENRGLYLQYCAVGLLYGSAGK
jgi:hypothetical protein